MINKLLRGKIDCNYEEALYRLLPDSFCYEHAHWMTICYLAEGQGASYSWFNVSQELLLMAPVIPSDSFYCTDSIFVFLFENDTLNGWS